MALKAREKALIGSLVLVGGLIATYSLVHDPLISKRAEARERLEAVESELITESKKLKGEGDLAERKALVAAREATVDAWVPGKNSAALLIWHLSQGELLSGAQIVGIQAGEKKLVNVAEAKAAASGQPAGEESEPADDGSQQQGQAEDPTGSPEHAEGQVNGEGQPKPQENSGNIPTLVMVPLELKMKAKFSEHLIFNQYMEETPLFLSTHGLSLTRAEELPMDRLTRLVEGGSLWLAGQLLAESPTVDGVYRVNLYFKADKAGPSTGEMQFDSQPGRVDPFVWDAVDEFIQALQASFEESRSQAGVPLSGESTEPAIPQLG